MTDFVIRVIVDPGKVKPGMRIVNTELDRTRENADRLGRSIRRALAFVSIGLVVRQVVKLADEFNVLQNQLRTVIVDQEELNQTFEELNRIANRTRTEIGSIVTLYQRGSIAAEELGASNEDMLKFVERVGVALAVQGGAASQASGALIQLSQSLSSGIVRAEEFNSILEGAFPIAQAAARGIDRAGGSVARLRNLIITGQVTSEEFFRGFLEGSEQLEEQFARTNATISQSFTILRNNLINFIGEADKANGASRLLSNTILSVADNIDTLARAAIFAATVVGVNGLAKAIQSLIATLRVLAVTLLTNPLTALLSILPLIIGFVVAFGDQIKVSSNKIANLQDVALAFFDVLKDIFVETVDLFAFIFPGIADTAAEVFGDVEFSIEGILLGTARVVDNVFGLFSGLLAAIKVLLVNLPAAIGIDEGLNKFIGIVEAGLKGALAFFNAFVGSLKTVSILIGQSFVLIGQSINAAFTGEFQKAANILDNANKTLESLPSALDPSILAESVITEFDKLPDQIIPRVSSAFEGGAKDLADVVLKAFAEGFDVNTAQALVNEVLARAEDRGADRQAREAAERAAKNRAREEEAGEEGAPGTKVGGGVVTDEAFDEVIKDLEEEAEILAKNSSEREIANQLRRIENALIKDNLTLAPEQEQAIEIELRKNQAIREEQQVLEELKGPMDEIIRRQETINRLRDKGKISVEELTAAEKDLKIQELELGTTAADGLVRGLKKIQKQSEDTSAIFENVLVNAFQSAEDALVEFALTGELNFSGFVDSLLADLARILARQALVALIGALSGPAGSVGTILTSVPAQEGFENTPPNQPFLVGEDGPEFVVPPGGSDIIPNDQTMAAIGSGGTTVIAAPAPVVNVSVVNVSDPQEALSSLDSPEGGRIILNSLSRNKTAARKIIA